MDVTGFVNGTLRDSTLRNVKQICVRLKHYNKQVKWLPHFLQTFSLELLENQRLPAHLKVWMSASSRQLVAAQHLLRASGIGNQVSVHSTQDLRFLIRILYISMLETY